MNSLQKAMGSLQRVVIGILAGIVMLMAGHAHAGGPIVLQFTATAGNTSGDTIYFNHPALNGKKSLKLIVTQYWTGTYNAVPVGVWLTGTTWAGFNEDQSSIPVGASFNVEVAAATQVNGTPLNSAHDFSTGSDFTLFAGEKNNPNAKFLLTHLWNPHPKLGGVYVDQNLGLIYNETGLKEWGIIPQAAGSAVAATYNVLDTTNDKNAFVLTTSASNIDGGDGVLIDNGVTNGNPGAVVFVTPVVVGGVLWNHPLGVYYNSGEWDIFNEDGTTMPAGLTFDVQVFSAPNP